MYHIPLYNNCTKYNSLKSSTSSLTGHVTTAPFPQPSTLPRSPTLYIIMIIDVSSELLYKPKPKTTTALIVIIAHDKTSGSVLVTWESSDLTTWHKLTNERAVIYPRDTNWPMREQWFTHEGHTVALLTHYSSLVRCESV